jgi:Zn ribbon nucleic-acid-binding protein
MENAILTSECMWCGTKYIKQHIGVSHGCAEEKAAKSEGPIMNEQEQIIDLFQRR